MLVCIKTDLDSHVHAKHWSGNYDSLCGLDADDPQIGHLGIVELPHGAKINCPNCLQIIKWCWEFKKKNLLKKL